MQNIKVKTGIQTYTFEDEDGHVFSKFRMNPTDINLAKRAMEVAGHFSGLPETDADTVDDIAKFNADLEEKISYVLGYDSREIFGEVTATTIFADGTVFAYLIMDKILTEIGPAMEKRQEKVAKASEKYLKKYRNAPV